MADKLLDVNGLTVSVEEKEILHDINLSINKGAYGTKRCRQVNAWICTYGQS